MTVLEFTIKYLNYDAIVTFCDDAGNINYTGRLGDAPRWTWGSREFIRVEGLGEENDLMIITSKRDLKKYAKNHTH